MRPKVCRRPALLPQTQSIIRSFKRDVRRWKTPPVHCSSELGQSRPRNGSHCTAARMGCNAWNHPPSCDCGWGGDTGGGGGGWHNSAESGTPRSAEPGRWGRYEAARFESYTIPNARCPVCHAKVFFYQSEHGGRVFFDPPLGPPWPKHPCTDNRTSGSAGFSQKRESTSSKTIASSPNSSGARLQESIDVMRSHRPSYVLMSLGASPALLSSCRAARSASSRGEGGLVLATPRKRRLQRRRARETSVRCEALLTRAATGIWDGTIGRRTLLNSWI